MKKIVIDAGGFKNKAEMFRILHEALGTENFYGSNLDALHDCLTMIFEPTRIVVTDFASAIAYLGPYADIFWHVLDDSAEENKNLHIELN